ncbi:MAG: YcxB family protein [Sedimentisphaerales bacterium]
MKISYKTTFRDLILFSWYHQTRSLGLVCFFLLVAGSINWGSMKRLSENHGHAVVFLTWIITTAVWFSGIFIFGFLLSVLSEISKKNKTLMVNNTIELTADSIILENNYGRSEVKWSIIQKLKCTKHFIYIYVAKSQAFIVLNRAFINKQDWNTFYNILNSHWTKTKESHL